MTAPENTAEEQAARALLRDVVELLAKGLDSLGGKVLSGKPQYVAWCALRVCKAADAYLYLRDGGKKDAAKYLVRGPLETTFKLLAVLQKPGMLFRVAYTEWQKEKRLLAKPPDATAEIAILAGMEETFRKHFPGEPRDRKQVKISELAEAAGLKQRYEGDYAVYCLQTHGALRAMMGELDVTAEQHDTRILALTALTMLDQLKAHTPAVVPDVQQLVKRYAELPRS